MRLFLLFLLLTFSPLLPAFAVAERDIALTREAWQASSRGDWKEAHSIAARSKNPVVARIIWWQRIRDKNSNAPFEEIRDFLTRYPDWPERDSLIARAESALDPETSLADRLKWFEQFPPKTGRGMQLYAEALTEQEPPETEKAKGLIREIWQNAMVKGETQEKFLAQFGNWLSRDDHVKAIDSLIWDDEIERAQELFDLVDEGHRRLFIARIKFKRNASGLDSAASQVPASLQRNAGFLFDRIVWRHERKMENGVLALFAEAPRDVPHGEKWWNIQRLYVWKFIEDGNYKAAYALAENHSQEAEGKSLADAQWLCGWLSYAYLRNPARAYTHFYKLYHSVQFPVSKSRGAYWAGKAATAHGSAEIGQRWLKLAAEYPATFYGQLALAEIHGKAGASLPPPIRATPSETKIFAARPVAQAALILDEMGENAHANKFLMHLVQNAKSHTERAMAAEMMEDIGKHYLTVKVAKEAMKFNTVLPDIGYPIVKFTAVRDIEPALPLAIARQESEFNANAESTAGALGLMQLLPSTAKEVARKIGVNFNKGALTANPSYNMQLGSTYLADLISAYRGSYIMAIAAYNAGPGRVSKWREEFGDPRDPEVDPILWIERIPFTETRNYVQRVLENLQMYRHRMNDYKTAPVQILQDLRRGS